MVETDARVPNRVPNALRDVHRGLASMHQHQVDVTVWRALSPPEATGRDERDAATGDSADRSVEQAGEPMVERRRTLVACGGAYLCCTQTQHIHARAVHAQGFHPTGLLQRVDAALAGAHPDHV